ncbi:MAG: hypothetical protein R3Y56_06410 [Akkermansia sp.]
MTNDIKIGIIQNAPLSADFSANLRAIVQAYRDCIDRGANLVIAPAYALTGPELLDLSQRPSFQQQNQLALETLAKEIAHAPLIVASYSTGISADDEENIFGLLDSSEFIIEAPQVLCPFLLEDGAVTQLEEGEVCDILGLNVYVEVGDIESMTDINELDLFVRLSTDSWYAGASNDIEESRRWEAQINNCPLLNIHSVGYAEGNVYAGGSCFYDREGTPVHRLPFFESAQAVIALSASGRARALPEQEALLRSALSCCLRDYTRNMGYVGIAINIDLPNSGLLALLGAEALGAQHVHAYSFEQGENLTAKALGIKLTRLENPMGETFLASVPSMQQDTLPSLEARLKAALLSSLAEQDGLALISPLNRHQLLMGEFSLYGESCAKLLPFGGLYEMDLYLLSKHISDERPDCLGALAEPSRPQIDKILHRMQDNNCSAHYIIHESEGELSEQDVRLVQRRVLTSAEKRAQLPPILMLEAKGEQLRLPICHRLND